MTSLAFRPSRIFLTEGTLFRARPQPWLGVSSLASVLHLLSSRDRHPVFSSTKTPEPTQAHGDPTADVPGSKKAGPNPKGGAARDNCSDRFLNFMKSYYPFSLDQIAAPE